MHAVKDRRAMGRTALAACAAAAVALAAGPQLDPQSTASAVVVIKKADPDSSAADSPAAAPADSVAAARPDTLAAPDREAYYLDFGGSAAADSTGADSLEYYLDFEPQGAGGSPGRDRRVYEILIDDDEVRIESPSSGYREGRPLPRWDEPYEDVPPAECCDADDELDFGLDLGYQRVDGLSVGLTQDLDHTDWRVPRIRLREIYSAKQDKWFYDVGIEQRLLSFIPLYAGASVYKITDSNPLDKVIIGDTENTLAAFFLKEDYRDYFTREGVALHARFDLLSHSSFKVEYRDDGYSSLRRRADWSLLRGSTMFRPNEDIDDGDMTSIIASYTLDTVDGDKCVPNGAFAGVSVEKAGGGLGGRFDFTTVRLDARNYVKLNPSQFLRYRFMLGSRTQGTLPLQKEFYVGGIGTLRGHDFKELTGDQMVLGNIEYGVRAGKDIGVFLFVDSGKAWYGDGGFGDQRLELDAGVGLEILCNQTQIYAATDVKESGSPVLVGLRLNRTF